jgi:hypothetical protein
MENTDSLKVLVPTEKAVVFWRSPYAFLDRTYSVVVLAIPKSEGEDRFYDKVARDIHMFPCNNGACSVEWLKHLFPEHLFAEIIAELGGLSPEQHQQAFWETVRQFARIRDCGWARRMYEQRENRQLTRLDLEPYCILPDGTVMAIA